MTIEALDAVEHLLSQGINYDLIDLRSVCPLNWESIKVSVNRTSRLLVLDTGHLTGSISGEIAVASHRIAGLRLSAHHSAWRCPITRRQPQPIHD